jgi:hypothetical protein
MAGKTVEDLKELRSKLVERRRHEAYGVGSEFSRHDLEELVQVHLAIEALDAVIETGADEPERGPLIA